MKETIPVMINDSLARQMANGHAYDQSLGAMPKKEELHLDSLKDVNFTDIDFNPSESPTLFASVPTVIWILLGAIIVAIIAYWAYRSGLFEKLHKEEEEEQEEEEPVEDDIHDINFDDEMDEAQRQHDYARIVRLVYLRTLHALDERHTIRWHISKTPSQYANEVRHTAFDRMTHHFLHVRYGKFPATSQMSDEMQTLSKEVLGKKGGDA